MLDDVQNAVRELPIDPETRRVILSGQPARRSIDLDQHQALLDNLGALFSEGSTIGDHLRALSRLFTKALADIDGQPGHFGELVDAGYLIVDITQTMATRLDALEARALEQIAQDRLETSR